MELGELPESWSVNRLADLCEIRLGKTPARGNRAYWEGDKPWAAISDLNDEVLTQTKEGITEAAVRECGCKIVPKGTLLFSFKLSIGKMAFAGIPIFTNEAIAALPVKPSVKLEPRFLFYALKVVPLLGRVSDAAKGMTLNKQSLAEIQIPIPPLAEQRRIVARVEALTSRLDQARQARQAALAEAENLMQAAMQSAFEGSEDFTEAPLGNLCTMKTGKTPPTGCPEYFAGDIPFVCPADVGQSLRITTAARRVSRQAVTDGKANLFPRGTVLVVGIGSTVGKVGLAAADVCTNQQITGLTFRKGILPGYAAWFLTSQRAVIENAASDGGVPIINQNGMGQLAFRFPESTDEQRAIVAQLDALRAKLDELQRLQRKVESELASFTPALLARAFRGEL
jgi:type I restriction enzyme S subunit